MHLKSFKVKIILLNPVELITGVKIEEMGGIKTCTTTNLIFLTLSSPENTPGLT
jgi:hypothetical protein